MTRYANVAIALHWLLAVLLIAQIYVGWTFGDMPRGPERGVWFDWHKTLGFVILLLSIVRLGWRIANPPPPLPANMAGWEKALSRLVHVLFYVILIGLPLTGWLIISAGRDGGGTTLLGGLPWPFLPGIPEGAREAAGAAHGVLVKTTYALIILHVGAALKHQFIDKAHNGRMPPL